jgi:hypothetical protein
LVPQVKVEGLVKHLESKGFLRAPGDEQSGSSSGTITPFFGSRDNDIMRMNAIISRIDSTESNSSKEIKGAEERKSKASSETVPETRPSKESKEQYVRPVSFFWPYYFEY